MSQINDYINENYEKLVAQGISEEQQKEIIFGKIANSGGRMNSQYDDYVGICGTIYYTILLYYYILLLQLLYYYTILLYYYYYYTTSYTHS